MKKYILSAVITTLLIGAFIALIRWEPQAADPVTTQNGLTENVRLENGVQYIDLTAKGGYAPGNSIAQAGIPTILRVNTNGTFDCSSALTIPEKKVSVALPPSDTTEIDLGIAEAGILEGTCSMGMYDFDIEFL